MDVLHVKRCERRGVCIMSQKIRVVHYLNQFFGQVGGEEKASVPPSLQEGPVGPGRQLNEILAPKAEIVATVIAGDNYMGQDLEKGAREVIGLLSGLEFDVFVSGPAFGAGRYGMACGAVCKEVSLKMNKPAVSAMDPENPGVQEYRGNAFILSRIGVLALKLGSGQQVSPETDGYLPQGRRVNVFVEKRGAVRAIDMIMAKVRGEPFETELPMPVLIGLNLLLPLMTWRMLL